MCRACKAKDQTITVLADQVDFLRAQLAAAMGQTPLTGNVIPDPPLEQLKEMPTFKEVEVENEDEYDIKWALANDLISKEDAERALAQIRSN